MTSHNAACDYQLACLVGGSGCNAALHLQLLWERCANVCRISSIESLKVWPFPVSCQCWLKFWEGILLTQEMKMSGSGTL